MSRARPIIATITALLYWAQLISACDPRSGGGGGGTGQLGHESNADTTAPDVPSDYNLSPTEQLLGSPGVTVGEVPFSHSVSADGAAQVTVPINVPPGRQGMQPNLALSYSSRGGDGPLGVGWQLSGLSSIQRCRKNPAQDTAYGGSWPEAFCLDGARLVPVVAGSNEYRTEVDSFRKIVANQASTSTEPDSFTVYEPDGRILSYASRVADSHALLEGTVQICVWGASIGGCLIGHDCRDDAADKGTCRDAQTFAQEFNSTAPLPPNRRAWMLDHVEDRFHNGIDVDYVGGDATTPGEVMLPAQIHYTTSGQRGPAPTKRVEFAYDTSRPDKRKVSIAGVEYFAQRRLTRILISGPLKLSHSNFADASFNGLLRSYELSYSQHPATGQSILVGLKECSGESPSVCKSPLKFDYSQEAGAAGFREVFFNIPNLTTASPQAGFRAADVDGDGRDDILYDIGQTDPKWLVGLSDGDALAMIDPRFPPLLIDGTSLGLGLVNMNRDDAVDLVAPLGGGNFIAALGRPQAQFASTMILPGLFEPGADVSEVRLNGLGDVNGDSLPDLTVLQSCRPLEFLQNVPWCRWAWSENKTPMGGSLDFASANDFRRMPGPCMTPATGPDPNCLEGLQSDPTFVVDIDGNGVNELLVPVRAPAGVALPRDGHSLELKALGLPSSSGPRRTGLSSEAEPRVFVDINGDGLPDSARIHLNKFFVEMNVGGSFDARDFKDQTSSLSAVTLHNFTLPNELRVADFNNDGLEDILLVSTGTLLQANGIDGFVERPNFIIAGDESCPQCTDARRRSWDQVLDFNGDGLVDVLESSNSRARLLLQNGPAPGLLQGISGGPLTPEVKLSYKPAGPGVHEPGACTFPQFCLKKGLWLVADVGVKADAVDNGINDDGFNHTTYGYYAGRYDVRGRGWLGFAKRVAKDEQTKATVTTTYDNITPTVNVTDGTSYLYAGAFRPTSEVLEADDGAPNGGLRRCRRLTTTYQYTDRFSAGLATALLSDERFTEEEAVLPASSACGSQYVALRSRHQAFTYSQYGLVKDHLSESFEGGFASGGMPASAQAKSVRIQRVPSTEDLANWLVRRFDTLIETSTEPARPAVSQQSGTRTTAFTWQPGTTSVASVTVEPNSIPSDAYSQTAFFRDGLGNITSINESLHPLVPGARCESNDPDCRETTIAWDTLDQTFKWRVAQPVPTASTTPPSCLADLTNIPTGCIVSSYYYHAGLGSLAVSDDPNAHRSQIGVDWFGRRMTVSAPGMGVASYHHVLTSDGLLKVDQDRSGTDLSASAPPLHADVLTQYSDKWGQTRRLERVRKDGKAIVLRSFTRLHQLATESEPAFGAEVPQYFNFRYDNMGRLVGRLSPERDDEKWVYDGLTTHHKRSMLVGSAIEEVDATTRVDGAGRVVTASTVDPSSAHQVATSYEFAPFNLLQTVIDVAGNRIDNEYDVLGRRTKMADPDRGIEQTFYDGFGNVRQVTNGAGVVTSTLRDRLSRPLFQNTWTPPNTPAGKPDAVERFTWDAAPNGVGQLSSATSADGIQMAFAYDSASRLTTQSWLIDGKPFVVDRTWDSLGRQSLVRYPSVPNNGGLRLGAQYQYDSASGDLRELRDADNAQNLFWSLINADASGIPLAEQYGFDSTQSGAVKTTRALDGQKRLRYQETTVDAMVSGSQSFPGKTLQRLSYEYGAGGLVKTRNDVGDVVADTATEDFDYDFLGRLHKWTVYQNCSKSEQQYNYDDIGNLTSRVVLSGQGQNVTNNYGPSSGSPAAGPHALRDSTEMPSPDGTLTYQYDGAGRRLSHLSQSPSGSSGDVTWTHFDLPSRIRSGQREVRYRYDAMHQRTVKDDGGSMTTYIGGLYESRPGGVHRFKLVTPGAVVGEVEWQETSPGVGKLSFYHPDSLGTPETVSSSAPHSAVVPEKVKYEPFGQRRFASALAYPTNLPSNHSDGFTGHEADDEFGFINMRGRVYDARVGRFLTADPHVQSPAFSQSLNRYSYVFNSPLNAVDPSGFDSWGGCISNGGDSESGGCSGAGSSAGPGGGGGGGTNYESSSGNPLQWLIDLFRGNGGGGCGANQACSGGGASGGGGGSGNQTNQSSATAPTGAGWSTATGAGAGQDSLLRRLSRAAAPYAFADVLQGSHEYAEFRRWFSGVARSTGARLLTNGNVLLGSAMIAGSGMRPENAVFDTLRLGTGAAQAADAQSGEDAVVPVLEDVKRFATGFNLLASVGAPLAAAANPGAAASGTTTTLYRAVSEAEHQQLMQTGRFAEGPNSLAGKFFAESAEDAAKWGERLQGAGNYRVISAELPTETASQFMRWERLDSIGPARYGELDQLVQAIIRSVP